MKGNDKWMRRRVGDRVRLVLLGSVLLMGSYKLWDIFSLGTTSISARLRKGKIRRQHGPMAILEGHLHLVDLHIPPGSLSVKSSDYANTIVAEFCIVDWELQKKNPSAVAMFRDLIHKSTQCQSSRYQMPLKEILRKTKNYDRQSTLAKKPAGFVFHETRCGSTLVANILASFSPDESKVYSESPPPIAALRACETQPDCDPAKAAQVLKDVIYLMSRGSEEHVFFKIQSVGVRSINIFHKAFPTTPWLFVYRNPVEVFMSHYKNGLKHNAVCMRSRRSTSSQITPQALQHVVQSKGRQIADLSNEEFCAAHLASLCQSAIAQHQASQTGRFVNYNQLPDIMWESVLPNYFGIPVDSVAIERIKTAAGVYSKGGRGKRTNETWKDDSTRKQGSAPRAAKQACHDFLEPLYNTMERYADELKQG